MKNKGLNVILFLVDALRPDHLGCYGYGKKTSPFIDRLANESLLFKNAVATASFTMPSHKAIFTSVYDKGGNLEKLRPGIKTVAEILQEKGFATAGFMSNAITSRETGLGNGFGFFDQGWEGKALEQKEKGRNAIEAIEAASKWIESNSKKPFFCFIQVVDTHGPYTPPQELAEMFGDEDFGKVLPFSQNDLGYKSIPKYQAVQGENRLGQYIARYDAAIRLVDCAVEMLWEKVKEKGLDKNTAFVFTSDHGESFGEHDWFFCHGIDLYEESIRVPLILRAPGAKAKAVKQQASHLDIAPTILDLAGVEKPEEMQGQSLLALGKGRARELFFEMNSDIHSTLVNSILSGARTNEWKYLETMDVRAEGASPAKTAGRIAKGLRKGGFGLLKSTFSKARHVLPRMLKAGTGKTKTELYDLKADPAERNNLAGKRPELAGEMAEKLRQWKARQKAVEEKLGQPGQKLDATEEMQERLRKLGYFG